MKNRIVTTLGIRADLVLSLPQYEKNPRARVVQVVAAYEELVLEIVPTNPFAEGGAGAEYLAKFPLGLVSQVIAMAPRIRS